MCAPGAGRTVNFERCKKLAFIYSCITPVIDLMFDLLVNMKLLLNHHL